MIRISPTPPSNQATLQGGAPVPPQLLAMLKGGGGPPQAPLDPAQGSPTQAGPEPDADDAGGEHYGVVPPENAGYQGPDQGPFRCGSCSFFVPDSSECHVVAGKVDAEGCCNNFVKGGGDEPQEPDQDDMGAVPPDMAPSQPPPQGAPQ